MRYRRRGSLCPATAAFGTVAGTEKKRTAQRCWRDKIERNTARDRLVSRRLKRESWLVLLFRATLPACAQRMWRQGGGLVGAAVPGARHTREAGLVRRRGTEESGGDGGRGRPRGRRRADEGGREGDHARRGRCRAEEGGEGGGGGRL